MANHNRNFLFGVFVLFSVTLLAYRNYQRRPIILSDGSELYTGYLSDGTFYRQVFVKTEVRSDIAVLLLHGAAFSSKIWETLGTFEKLSIWGIPSVAIDMPSYKRSKSVAIPKNKSGYLSYIKNQFEVLKNRKFILVTPSMSGGYAMRYLLEESENLAGFVAVAPATSNAYGPSTYSTITTKTIFIYGSKDKNLGKRGSELFRNIPNSEIFMVNGGSHSCYLDYPDVWHEQLEHFLKNITITVTQNE